MLVVGGGSGSSNILRELKKHDVDITAIVTMFDSGGSTGQLRSEFGYPSFGDLRQCIVALGDDRLDTKRIGDALQFRFGTDTSVNGHSVGNLLLAALTSLNGDLEDAISDISNLLRASGRVVPVTLSQAELCAELEDGQFLRGEAQIDLRGSVLPRIAKIFLDERVDANPNAIKAVQEADIIIFGPGDLYTSILPNLLPDGMRGAFSQTRATKILVCNLMTKRGETDDFKAPDFVRELKAYLGGSSVDWVIVNSERPPAGVERTYEAEGASFVDPDLVQLGKLVSGVMCLPLASSELPLRHNADRTIKAILQASDIGFIGVPTNGTPPTLGD